MANSQKEREGAAIWTDFQAILQLQEEGVAILSRDGRVKYINPAAIALLGSGGRVKPGDIFPYPIVSGAGEDVPLEIGDEQWVQMRFHPVNWENSQAYFVQIKDLSERKREEELLHRAVEAAETRAAELEALKFVADQLNQAAVLEEAIQSGLETVLALIDAVAAWVLLPEENGDIRMIASYSHATFLKSERRTLSAAFHCEGLDMAMKGLLSEPKLVENASCMIEAGLSPALPNYHYSVPLEVQGSPTGVLNLVLLKGQELAAQDLRLLKTISQQFAVAIQRSLPLSALAAARLGQGLPEAGRAGAPLDLPGVLQNVLKLAVEMVGAEVGSLGLLNQNRVNLTFHSNLPETDRRQSLLKSDNAVWQVIESGKSTLLAGTALRENLPKNFCPDAKSLILTPVVAGRKVLGVLALYTTGEDKSLNAFDQAIAESLGQQAGIAVQNAQLFFEVQQLTTTDPLTGLNNQKSFINQAVRELERTWRYKRPLSIISLVVDDIRSINEHFGRDTGDRVLHSLGRICTDSLRRVDVIGRYAGNNFVILLPETEQEGARDVAERLRTRAEAFRMENPAGLVTFSISVGVAGLVKNEVIDLERLIDRANQALYTALQSGGNQTLVWQNPGKIR